MPSYRDRFIEGVDMKSNMKKMLEDFKQLPAEHKREMLELMSSECDVGNLQDLQDLKNFHKRLYTEMSFCPREEDFHRNRANESLEQLRPLLQNKFLCHLGCGNGIMTKAFSEATSNILGLEKEKIPFDIATKEDYYHCPVEFHHCDAFKYLQENPEINPDVFYFLFNYNAVESCIERIIELRGHTNPTIISGIGMHRFMAPVDDNGDPLQFLKAKELKEKYNGEIRLMKFPINRFAAAKMGLFGVLILNHRQVSNNVI